MDDPAYGRIHDRYDRHVRRARLCVEPHAPGHRLGFTIEEALRLASLPGENEGRSYYFRRLRVTGLPASGDRDQWLEKFQRALDGEAERAIHGADPRAASANAVFFRGEQEALEILLHRVLSRQAIREWFWPMITGHDSPLGGGSIVDIVEKLKDRPASWVAVAAALFATAGFDVVRMLEAIPSAVVESWLRDMTGPHQMRGLTEQRIPPQGLSAVQRALVVFGLSSPRVLWLATLAILLDSPAEMAAGTAVWRAQSALPLLAGNAAGVPIRAVFGVNAGPESSLRHNGPSALPALLSAPLPDAPRGPAEFEDARPGSATSVWSPERNPAARASSESKIELERSPRIGPMPAPAPAASRSSAEWADRPERLAGSGSVSGSLADAPGTSPDSIGTHAKPVSSPSLSAAASPAAPDTVKSDAPVTPLWKPVPVPWYCSGLRTRAAGLFFLLNALRRIGMPSALAAGLAAAGPNFPVRVLQRLVVHAGAGPEDPIPAWLSSLLASDTGSSDLFPCDASCWPLNLRPSRNTASLDYMVRVWCLAVRRWCWRAGKIVARDVILRSGVFSVNRTDLDVSLSLDGADVRVRRAGLDLDPGWLPWFGRVVRFHYLSRGEFRA